MEVINFKEEFLNRSIKLYKAKEEISKYEFTELLTLAVGMLFPVKEKNYNSPDSLDKFPKTKEILKKELPEGVEADCGIRKKIWINNEKGERRVQSFITNIDVIKEGDFLRHFRNSIAHLRVTAHNVNEMWIGVILRDYPSDRNKDEQHQNFYLYLTYDELNTVLFEVASAYDSLTDAELETMLSSVRDGNSETANQEAMVSSES